MMVEVFGILRTPEKVFARFKEPLLKQLPDESRTALAKFRKPDDFQRSLLGEALARMLLSSLTGKPAGMLPLGRTEKGKPVLMDQNELHYNISHSGDWVVVAISNHEVGIDVEKIRDPDYRIAERFFSPLELGELNGLSGEARKNYFFDLWTLKESYLKLLGKGLTQSLGSFTMTRRNDGFKIILNGRIDDTIHFFQDQIDPEYRLSVCCRSPIYDTRVVRVTADELLNKLEHGNKI